MFKEFRETILNSTFYNFWKSATRRQRRTVIALAIFLDASLGLLYQKGSLNLLDFFVGGAIPNDLSWLLQIVEAASAAFFAVKIVFDDLPKGKLRTSLIFLSPVFLLFSIWVILEFLFLGLDKDATVIIDMGTIGIGTLTWSSTYLAIAVGLTLTYKVQRYGNFAQSELFMIGMYLSMVMIWSDFFFPLYDANSDGVLVWSLLLWTLVAAFFLTGIAGVLIDRMVYRGFREKGASPQIMMIASLGVALILRALTYLRFGAGINIFEPDRDWRIPSLRWNLPTTKFRFNLGTKELENGATYTGYECDSGHRVVHEGAKPSLEVYDKMTDCVTEFTTGYPYYKGAVPVVVFTSVILLLILLKKTRLGRRMRAVADNPDLAASSGINVERIQMTSAFLSAGISGVGGAVFAMTLRFSPETAFTLLLPSFAIIVLGTIGSIEGAIVGALVVGFVRTLSSPVLIGIGLDLGRSNYTALENVMPYIFLVAILMIMPEGIGDAYEKWKVERLRRKAEQDKQPSEKVGGLLAISPFGALGAHNFWRGKNSRGETMFIVTLGSYFLHRISRFVSGNSLAPDSCSKACQESSVVDSNFELLTGRTSGEFILEDSPLTQSDLLFQKSPPSDLTENEIESWTDQAVLEMNESWLSMMNFEIQLVDLIVSAGDVVWPAIPIIIWGIAVLEGIYALNGTKKDPLEPIFGHLDQLLYPISVIRGNWSGLIERQASHLNSAFSDFQRRISILIGSIIFQITDSDAYKAVSSHDFINRMKEKAPYGRESPYGSWMLFSILLMAMLALVWWLPVADQEDARFIKVLQVSNVLVTLSIFALMAFSLNVHTGVTGLVNFGVIFFVGIGAISVGILTAPENLYGYDWPVFSAVVAGAIVAALIGWLLAYPTARLRMDYFAIVTISLGEILRYLLMGESLLRAGTFGNSMGISNYKLPLKSWWFCGPNTPTKDPLPGPDGLLGTSDDLIREYSANECSNLIGTGSMAERVGDLLNLGQPAPYMMVLAIFGLTMMVVIWLLLDTIFKSPWGRILKSIREDEEVAQHHGHDILTHKAASLALGAAIAALAGSLWAWKLTGFQPSFMAPARTTFLVWCAFVVGGMGNNRGMVIGAFIYVIMEFLFNVLVAAQGTTGLPLNDTADRIDSIFAMFVNEPQELAIYFALVAVLGLLIKQPGIRELGFSGCIVMILSATLMDQRSISESFIGGVLMADMAYFKVLLIGSMILLSLKYNPKGLLPEVPNRPERPSGGE